MAVDPPSPPRVGRPRSEAAASHAAILDAVHDLLKEKSARELSMDAVAKRAGVGKPTLYKWWPSKASLILAMFHERMVAEIELPPASTAETIVRFKARRLVGLFEGLFGKVMAELIAEGQSNPALLRELYDNHIGPRRAATIGDIVRGKERGELRSEADPELLVDAIIGPLYFRRLLGIKLTLDYADGLVDQAFAAVRTSA